MSEILSHLKEARQWATNDDGTVYIKRYLVMPNPLDDLVTDRKNRTITTDTTEKKRKAWLRPLRRKQLCLRNLDKLLHLYKCLIV